ncbi:MAG TPA: SDR family oxidoreductase [Flavisolibacter sp.]|jgi:short-subunit dehydrogenase
MNDLSGKTVVITGASSGAGRAIAVELAKNGARLVLGARREQALEEVAAECRSLGGDAHAVVTDTRDAEAVHRLLRKALELDGKVDVWINNAGVLAAGELEQVPAAVNEAVIRTNLIGYIHGAHAVLPVFKRQGQGILINNISIGGWFPTPYMTAYCASKFGLRGYSESLKGELKDYPHIHVCDLYPAFLDTPGMQHSANFTGKQLSPSPPLYDPRKVASAVVRLISRPRSKTTLGAFPVFLRMASLVFPVLSRSITASLIKNYLKGAAPTVHTSGNVLQPVDYGTGIDGGWRNVSLKPAPRTRLLLFAAAAGLLLLGRR